MCLNVFPHTYNNTKICKYKTKIILDVDRNLILLSLNTRRKQPPPIQDWRPMLLQNIGNVVIQGEKTDPSVSLTVPSRTHSDDLFNLCIHLISRM